MNRRSVWLPAALASAFLLITFCAAADVVLLPQRSVWKYFAVTNDVGTDWREFTFDDSPWARGPAQLGYGDQDESTVVPVFYDSTGRENISTYFRASFVATNPATFTNLLVRLLRDDGAVVYLNGLELFRDNMPAGAITFSNVALSSISSPEENTLFVRHYLDPSGLRDGTNVLAVEIHQYSPLSEDISFDLEMIANTLPSQPPSVVWTNPYPGTVFPPGSNATLDVTASDPDGAVTRVEFFANSNKLGELTAPPYRFVWSNIPVGLHILAARATDNTGVQSNSAPLLIRAGGLSLVSTGSVWKYNDDQSDPGVAWRQPAFDDSGWSNGVAQLGFGDGDEATLVRWKIDFIPIITAYFRRQFVSPNPASFSALMLRLLRDDGGVVYLNGVEVFRSNMPDGPVDYFTYALNSIGTGPEETIIYFPTNLLPGLLVEGTNTLAVEIHQITQFSSTDLSFDAELTAFPIEDATRLRARVTGTTWEISWPAWIDQFRLESAFDLSVPAPWTPVTNAAENVGGRWTITTPLEGSARFFRLRL